MKNQILPRRSYSAFTFLYSQINPKFQTNKNNNPNNQKKQNIQKSQTKQQKNYMAMSILSFGIRLDEQKDHRNFFILRQKSPFFVVYFS